MEKVGGMLSHLRKRVHELRANGHTGLAKSGKQIPNSGGPKSKQGLFADKNFISKIEFSSVLIIGTLLVIILIAIVPPIRAGILSIISLSGSGNTVKEEVVEKRTEYSKVFKNENGSFTALIFADPVHYQNGNGDWEDLEPEITNAEVHKAPFDAVFGKTPGLEFKAGKTTIELVPQQANSVEGKIEENKITYEEAFESADLRYAVGAARVKEEIILKSKLAPSSYSFRIVSNEPIPSLKDNELVFSSCKILAPFAYDANGRVFPVNMDVIQLTDGDYLILRADQDWLAGVKYPVVIDPTIEIKLDKSLGKDTYVDNRQPDTNFANLPDLAAYDNIATKTRSYIQFDLGSIPKGSTISGASLQLYAEDELGGNLYLRKVTSSWDEASLTWNNQPLFEEVVDARIVDNKAAWAAWDITKLVNDWIGGKIVNHGVVLLSGEAGAGSGGLFSSSDFSADIALRPKLVVDYVPDSALPASVITEPKDNIYVKGSSCTIQGSANDNPDGSGLLRVQVSTDGGVNWHDAAGTDSWTYSWTVPPDGDYNIKSRAIDIAGNIETSSAGLSVTVDNALPNALISAPRGGAISGTLIVSGAASDENFKSFRLQYGEGNSPTEWKRFEAVRFEPVLNGHLGSVYTYGLNNGIYTIQLVVEDKAGNIGTDQVVVVADN